MNPPLDIPKRNDLLILPDISTPEDRALEKKRIRRHLILNAIREHGPLSRADITRTLGFNSQTVKTMVTELVDEGLVIEDEEERVIGMGRPPTPCRLNPKAAMVFGLAISRNRAVGVLADLVGERLLREEEETPEFSSPIAEAGWVKDFAARVLGGAPRNLPPLAGVAIGVPRSIEAENPGPFGVLVPSARSTAGVITRAIQRDLHLPVLANSQSRLNAIGAIWYGPAKRYRHFVFLDLGEVPRVVVVTNGRIHQGVLGRAGELWDVVLPGHSEMATPARKKRLGSLLSIESLLERALVGGLDCRSLGQLVAAAKSGNDKAVQIFQQLALDLTDTIAMFISLYNPDAVVIGGAIAFEARQLIEPALRSGLESIIATEILMRTELEFAPADPCGDTAACAAAYALHHIFTPTYFDLTDLL